MVTLGCARNEVDSEELAGRLAADGYDLVDDADDADAVLVNTCGFIETAKKDSVDAILAADRLRRLRRRRRLHGRALRLRARRRAARGRPSSASTTTRAIGDRLDDVLAGRPLVPHTPARPPHAAADQPGRSAPPATAGGRTPRPSPGHDWLRRKRLASGPSAALKLASGCDRRCAFCAIPTFRGAFVSRPPAEVLGEAQWLASQGVTELVLVSENSTSYGKDLGDLRLAGEAAARSWPRSRASPGCGSPTCSRPSCGPACWRSIAGTPGVAPYFDLSFQHSSPTAAAPDAPLRRHRRLPAR